MNKTYHNGWTTGKEKYKDEKTEWERKICNGLAAKGHFYTHASTKCSSQWINHMPIFICFLSLRSCYFTIFPLSWSLPHPLPPLPTLSSPIPNFTSVGNQYLCSSYKPEHLLPSKKKKSPHCLTSFRAKTLKDLASSKKSYRRKKTKAKKDIFPSLINSIYKKFK